ncbi:MAG: hypothetical protein LC674_05215 [Actinobacteria bacterium]|nr:hypothetical protein [Actinomycetota bacterium]
MRSDLIQRLAAANPVPTDIPLHSATRSKSTRRNSIAIALAAAIAVPTVAFAGELGNLLGITNEGTSVPTGSVLPGESRLDEALQNMNVGATMQALGTLNGIAFYATRNAAGNFCLAVDHTNATIRKGVLCDLNADNFPSRDVKAISFPKSLFGVAADGVSTVALVDATGNVIDSTPVVNNLFASKQAPTQEPANAAYLEAFRQRRQHPQQTEAPQLEERARCARWLGHLAEAPAAATRQSR